MNSENKFILVLTTLPSVEKGEEIAKEIVEKRLAGCITIVPSGISFYWWEGKIDKANECLLLIKTKESLYKELEKELIPLHPYSVPEIIALPISEGFDNYLKWLEEETKV